MELLGIAAACCALLISAWCVSTTQPLRGRVSQLELERPLFLKQLQGLLDETEEQVERADAKRKRAENSLAAAQRMMNGGGGPQAQPRVTRGTYLEPL